jgi:hypothetical protein
MISNASKGLLPGANAVQRAAAVISTGTFAASATPAGTPRTANSVSNY